MPPNPHAGSVRYVAQASLPADSRGFPAPFLKMDALVGVPRSALDNRKSEIALDWSPMVQAILDDLKLGISVGEISAKFHNALAEMIVAVAQRIGVERVALSGGCFQNRYLTERTVRRLREEGFRPYWHQRVPPNDGGICLGQVVAALRGKE